MSEVSYIEKLLDGAGVDWRPLEDVLQIKRGKRLVKSQLQETGKFAVFQNSMTPLGYFHESNVTPESAFIICAGAAGEIGYSDAGFWAADDVYFFCPPETFLSKYLYYWLLTQKEKLSAQIRRASIPRLSKVAIEKLSFPIPSPDDAEKSLAVQAEIVRILDAFTALTAELTAELTARKKQYNYYRDQLLSFEGTDVEWKTLGEIGEFIRGKRFTKADYVDDGIDAIHYGEIYTRYGVFTNHAFSQVRREMVDALRYAEPGDVIMTGVGETVDEVGKAVAWLGDNKVAIHDDSYAFRHSMNPKFISYLMQTPTFIDQKAKHVSRGKLNRLLINGLEKVRIPIPYPNDISKSFAEQARIVSILDKFDALTNSLQEGLPREIELRQKQYEYYRDLLLNFPKPEGVAT